MKFDLYSSKIYRAVDLANVFPHFVLKSWRIMLLAVGGVAPALYGISLLLNNYDLGTVLLTGDQWKGLSFIFLPMGFSVLFFEIFFDQYLKYPKIYEHEDNIADYLDYDAASLVDRAYKISARKFDGQLNIESIILAILEQKIYKNIFFRLGINPNDLISSLDQGIYDGLELIDNANANRIDHGDNNITLLDLIISIYDSYLPFKQLLIQNNLDDKDLDNLAKWYEVEAEYKEKKKKFWSLDNLLRRPPVGVSWVYARTPLLQRFARPLGWSMAGKDIDNYLFGRRPIIDQIESILLKANESNVLLVGEPGVGKRTIVEYLAYLFKEGKVLPELKHKRILELDLASIVSSSKDKNQVQNLLVSVMNQAVMAGDIILVIENFHNFVGDSDIIGGGDISRVILPYLESPETHIIATTDNVSFHKHIESRPDIYKTFEKISVQEPDKKDVVGIIEEIVSSVEHKLGLSFTYPAIKAIVENSDKYIQQVPFPEKAINLLNDVAGHVKSQKKQTVLKDDVDAVVTLKTSIPLGRVGADEQQKLLNLVEDLHREIVGQNEAVKAVAETMQRLRAGLKAGGRPAGVFLFIGPTGVGKTQTAKALAKTYFGSSDKMIRLDMSEYQNQDSLNRFLGSTDNNEPGQLPSLVRDNPFSVLLLDEFEKANKNILNLFLQVFDEGRITDAFGRKVSFEQNIIIATSNAGAQEIREMVSQGLDPASQKEKIIDVLISKQYFTPELLNRFDQIVIFHPLSRDQALEVAKMLMNSLVLRLKDQGYYFNPSPELYESVAREGFDPQFGARPMQRVIRDKIESIIAKKILEGEIQKGQEFSL